VPRRGGYYSLGPPRQECVRLDLSRIEHLNRAVDLHLPLSRRHWRILTDVYARLIRSTDFLSRIFRILRSPESCPCRLALPALTRV